MTFARTFVLIAALVTTAAGCTVAEEPSPGAATGPVGSSSASGSATTATATQTETPSLAAPDRARLQDDLINATWENDVPRVRRLIGAGADVNDRTARSRAHTS